MGSAGGQSYASWFDSDGNYLSQSTFSINLPSVAPAGAYFVGISLSIDAKDDDMLYVTGSATAYEPYNATAYGGTLDLATGVLTVEWVSKNLGSFTWTKIPASKDSANTYFYFTDNNGTADGTRTKAATDVFSSALKVIKREDIYNIEGTEGIACEGFQTTKIAVYACISDTASLTAVQFADAVDGYYLAYKITTPIVYQLTPQEIQTLIGTNVIWSDTNTNMTVKYLKKG